MGDQTADGPATKRPSDDARARDRRHVWHTWSPISADRARLMFARGSGSRIWDVEGREYLDASSLNSTCGYANPDVAAAVNQQAMQFHGIDISMASHVLGGVLA